MYTALMVQLDVWVDLMGTLTEVASRESFHIITTELEYISLKIFIGFLNTGWLCLNQYFLYVSFYIAIIFKKLSS